MDMALPAAKRSAPPTEESEQSTNVPELGKKRARRLRQQTAEEKSATEFKKKIEQAAKDADAAAAIAAFELMKHLQLPINPYLHRVVINVCANDADPSAVKGPAFEVYEDLRSHSDASLSKARADEPVYSALIKICAKTKDFAKCHALLETMEELKIEPRLRTYASLLAAYAGDGNLEKALWVHQQLHAHEIELMEPEYVALFRACVKAQNAAQFDAILNEYRETFLVPGPDVWDVLKEWFSSDVAREEGRTWRCFTETIDAHGVSSETVETLLSIELPEEQKAALLEKIESLVRTDDKRTEQWDEFKTWLETHGPFDVILDAANIGYFNQNYSGGGFSYQQIKLMVEYYEQQGKKVLVVLHKRRTYDDIVPTEFHAMLKGWLEQNVMYNCRSGNNDDWYWLYAAVKLGGRTLVVTNDEMRDHHFQMIHTQALVRWKERHQVHYSIHMEKVVRVQEPPVFSARAQRIGDSWHFPSAVDPSKWLGFQLETATPE